MINFYVNSVSTSIFLFPRGWKVVLRHFLSFGRGRNAVFAVFRFSAVAETHFSPFFCFRPWPKRCFCCFLLFGHGRKSIFYVFSLSTVAETLFLLFSIHPNPRKAIFFQFFVHPSPRKAIICSFLLIRANGKRFF